MCSAEEPRSSSGTKDLGISMSPTIDSAKNAAPAATVFQRWRAHQLSTRRYQRMTGPSVWCGMLSDLRV